MSQGIRPFLRVFDLSTFGVLADHRSFNSRHRQSQSRTSFLPASFARVFSCLLFSSQDQRGFTPIHVAVTAGHSEAYVAILNAIPLRLRARALMDTEKSSGDNVLHQACAHGHANCVEAILREVRPML